MQGMSQVIQVMGAMVIFSLILMNMNRFMVLNDLALIQNEYDQVAMAVGQSLINEGRVLNFDEDDDPAQFTGPYSLGPGWDESRTDPSKDPYDDFDDFNGYNVTKNINGVDYQVDVEVCYVQQSDLDQCYYGSTTFHKLMTVTVNNTYMDTPIQLQTVKSYY